MEMHTIIVALAVTVKNDGSVSLPAFERAFDDVAEHVTVVAVLDRQKPENNHEPQIFAAWPEEREAATPEGEGWQPIESAPKDNKRLLYLARFNPDTGTLVELDFDGIWQADSESWELSKVYHYWASNGGIEEPTHWAYQDSPPPTALSDEAAPEDESGLGRIAGLTFYLHENPDSEQDEEPSRLVMGLSVGNDVFCHRATRGDNGICRQQPAGQRQEGECNCASGYGPEHCVVHAIAVWDQRQEGADYDSHYQPHSEYFPSASPPPEAASPVGKREAFERWARPLWGRHPGRPEPEYNHNGVQAAWVGWRAALASPINKGGMEHAP